jgi:acyl-coenzyme A synthetase/AMP-(fatty) acid ligase
VLPLASLTHTLGLFAALQALISAGAVALVTLSPFESTVVWDAVARDDVEILSAGSETSIRQLSHALRAEPRRWDLRRLQRIVASVPLSGELRHTLSDLLPTTEIAVPAPVARVVGERLRVLDERTGVDVEPGSGVIGAVAVGGANPVGYFKEPTKTGAQFRTIDGSRFWISGEYATVDADGVIRGASPTTATIVLGGRTVSAPLIERVLRKHPSVAECVVVGAPDARSREQVIALIQVVDDHHLDEAEMTAWCRSQLSAPETPSRFLFVAGGPPLDDRLSARRMAIETLDRERR